MSHLNPPHPQFVGRIDKGTFAAAAIELGAEESSALAAQQVYDAGRMTAVGYSGKMGSGKDTIADAVASKLEVPTAHVSFAATMKSEADLVIAAIQEAGYANQAALVVASEFHVSHADAQTAVDIIWEALANDPTLHARSRHPAIRALLQHWGTGVRRAQDPEYWVKRTLVPAVSVIAEGYSVCITDVRFPNEAETSQRMGIWVPRLEITVETQNARLNNRDGHLPDSDAFAHDSETALDDYPGFDLVIDNNGPPGPVIDRVITLTRTGH
jgi:dephospho-CoA kinase